MALLKTTEKRKEKEKSLVFRSGKLSRGKEVENSAFDGCSFSPRQRHRRISLGLTWWPSGHRSSLGCSLVQPWGGWLCGMPPLGDALTPAFSMLLCLRALSSRTSLGPPKFALVNLHLGRQPRFTRAAAPKAWPALLWKSTKISPDQPGMDDEIIFISNPKYLCPCRRLLMSSLGLLESAFNLHDWLLCLHGQILKQPTLLHCQGMDRQGVRW